MLEAGGAQDDLRELDRRVAKALGWKCPFPGYKCDGSRRTICGACGGHGHGNCYGNGNGPVQIECCEQMPGYSTDAACVGEMLEWSAAKGLRPNLCSTFERDGSHCGWRVWLNTEAGVQCDGRTLPEAVARAVAAVGAQERNDERTD